MKSLVLFFAICLFESFALPSTFAVAEKCGTACQRNKNCACASTESPIKVEETPQVSYSNVYYGNCIKKSSSGFS